MIRKRLIAAVLSLGLAAPAAAEGFARISEREAFLQTVDGKELRYGMFGIRLKVLPDGRIDGSAMGWDVTGSWEWRGGYFCREMDWSGKVIPMNCQLVETRGGRELRFTVDQGAGESASFRLR